MSNEAPFIIKESMAAEAEVCPVDFETLELLPLLPEEQPEEYLNRVRELFYRDKYGKSGVFFGQSKGFNIVEEPKYSKFFERSNFFYFSKQCFCRGG